MNQGGKGDKPRPISVPMDEFDNNWDRIFGKKKKEHKESAAADTQINFPSDRIGDVGRV